MAKSPSLKEACAEATQALAIHERAFGPTHQWTQDSAAALAAALDALGRGEEAAAARQRYAFTTSGDERSSAG